MKLGFKVALVSDAGTPTISDPGFKFLKEAKKEGIPVEPLPGPCAAITALSACGFPTDKFMFIGYLPKGENERHDELEELKKYQKTICVYESPSRLMKILNSIKTVFGPN
jgi:16S rRNA (cytidine1402-2'-O)-methyltransferase